MTTSSHPLHRPLPHDVAAGESAFIQYYQKYATFSWPWAWPRTVVFGGVSLLAAASYGASDGLMVKSVWEAVVVGCAVALFNIVLIGAGPLLAALARHSGWPIRAQHVCIVAAVILGTMQARICSFCSLRVAASPFPPISPNPGAGPGTGDVSSSKR